MKIMVCYTGSQSSEAALTLAIAHAKIFSGKIYLVASMEKGTAHEQDEINRIEQAHEKASERIKNEGVKFETSLLVRGMTPDEDLVDYASEKNVDEIVIGIRRRSKMGKLLFGSTAQYIILNAHCPVVTVK
jgi:nucleotide-binding universal stress UspA family protein